MSDKESTALTQVAPAAQARPDYGIDVARVLAMRAAVEEIVDKVLREGEHFGVIPGTTQEGKKPKKSLFQPGAEVLCQVFRMRPEPTEVTVVERDDFIFLKIRCKLYNSVTGELMGEALGSANTREEKYTSQTAAKLCPACGKPTIFKAKKRPEDTVEPGWFCWGKKGGCGAQFAVEDKKLLDQSGAISTDKVWNLHHTILSMAQKRAYVKAVRNATGTSDIFTDEDVPPDDDEHGGGHQAGGKAPAPRTQNTPPPTSRAGVTQVRDLNAALMQLEIGTAVKAGTPEAEAKEIGRKARMAWVNEKLANEEMSPVAGMGELAPEVISRLILVAKAAKGGAQ